MAVRSKQEHAARFLRIRNCAHPTESTGAVMKGMRRDRHFGLVKRDAAAFKPGIGKELMHRSLIDDQIFSLALLGWCDVIRPEWRHASTEQSSWRRKQRGFHRCGATACPRPFSDERCDRHHDALSLPSAARSQELERATTRFATRLFTTPSSN